MMAASAGLRDRRSSSAQLIDAEFIKPDVGLTNKLADS
jgi:hypothetical protein